MNVRHLAELAGLLSVHALQIVEAPSGVSEEALNHVTKLAHKRSEAWFLRMQSLSAGSDCWSALHGHATDPYRPLIEEILVSEILSRVVAGLFNAQGQQRGEKATCQWAAALFNHHQEARRRVLLKMLDMAEAQNPAVRKLDRLRRLAERWTDILLCPLACRFALGHLVFDAARSQEYGQAILPYLTSPAGSGLFAAGLSVAFPETLTGVPSHAGFHREMAAAVLGLLPAELFENDGGLLPLRTARSLQSGQHQDTPPTQSRRRRKPFRPSPSATKPQTKLSFHQLRRRRQTP